MWRLITFEEIFHRLSSIENKVNKIMANIQDIADAVAQQRTVEASATTMLNQLVQELKAAQANNDQAKMDQVLSDIQANTKTLSDAVAANTPAQSQTQQSPQ